MNIFDEGLVVISQYQDFHFRDRIHMSEIYREQQKKGKALGEFRKDRFDSLKFRSVVFRHFNDLEKYFGINIYDNPLISTYHIHLWNALNVYREDPYEERKQVRVHLAKALKEGRKIERFLVHSDVRIDTS